MCLHTDYRISVIIAGLASFRINFHYAITANTFWGTRCLNLANPPPLPLSFSFTSLALCEPIMKRNKFKHHFEASNFKKLAHIYHLTTSSSRRENEEEEEPDNHTRQ